MAFNPHQFNIEAFANASREDLVKYARWAETAERYEDMCGFMRKVVELSGSGAGLSVEERNLLSVAYKNVVGARRASWRALSADNDDSANATVYRQILESELESISNEVLGLLKDVLVPAAKSGGDQESQVFYLKMAGDYHRYVAEFAPDKGHNEQAQKNYEAATEVAASFLAPTHPIRLGLALNYSVCQYEILKNPESACKIARTAFDDAISKLDELDEASYKDSTLIMQLLRDNLTLWTSEQGDEEED